MGECIYPARKCEDCQIFDAYEKEIADGVAGELFGGEPFAEPELPSECSDTELYGANWPWPVKAGDWRDLIADEYYDDLRRRSKKKRSKGTLSRPEDAKK